MIHFEIPKNQSSILKVIGVGGGGSNAVNYMHSLGIEGVDFVVCNTDSQALTLSSVANKIQLGPHLTQGLGAGANPEIGKQSCEESIEDIAKILKVNTKMAFITAGMGGGTGTGGGPVVAKVCRDLGILTVGIVTTPFTYEGRKRMKQAQDGIDKMREQVDTILIISNDKLRQQFGNLPFTQAFAKADDILATAAKCITDVITSTGQINVDFADVCTVMKSGGVAILGSATAIGENRALIAVESALNSPLLNDSDITGAKWLLLNITSSAGEFEHTMDEAEAIQGYVQNMAGEGCDVILGMGHDPNLKDRISVTVIATGFNHKTLSIEMPRRQNEPKKITLDLDNSKNLADVFNTQEVKTITKQTGMAPSLVEVPDTSLNIFGMTPGNSDAVAKEPIAQNGFGNDASQREPAKFPAFLNGEKTNDEKVQVELVMKPQETHNDFFIDPFKDILKERGFDNMKEPTPEPLREHIRETPKDNVSPFREPQRETPKENVVSPFRETTTPREPFAEPTREQPKESPKEQRREPAREAWEPVRDAAPYKRTMSDEEMEEKRRFEEQKKALEDRAERLRRMSFNIRHSEGANEMENEPAYKRKNRTLDNQTPSTDNQYSGYAVGNDKNQGIQSINTFLDGKQPD